MNPETLTALKESIVHWTRIELGLDNDIGGSDCALCQRFAYLNAQCERGDEKCPVYARTGCRSCRGSPYQAVRACTRTLPVLTDELRKEGGAALQSAIEKELAFLKSLLPSAGSCAGSCGEPSGTTPPPATPAPVFEGLNPQNLSIDALLAMPVGARLLECDEERRAFAYESKAKCLNDLFAFTSIGTWLHGVCGPWLQGTYCTTRPKGWWRSQVSGQVSGQVFRAAITTCVDMLSYIRPPNRSRILSHAVLDPDFIGYEYEDGTCAVTPRRLTTRDKPAEVPIAVLFRTPSTAA